MNLIDLVREYRIPYKEQGQHHHTTHGWLQVDCPWCSKSSGRFRLGINLRTGATVCWQCGWSKALETLCELTGESANVLKGLLGSLEGISSKQVLRAGRLRVPSGVGPLLPIHRRYLRSRGFDPNDIQRLWGVQGIGLAARLAWRLYIPVTTNGTVASFTTRSLNSTGLRYISAGPTDEVRPLKSLLYGADHARHAVVVCEGPLDCWAIGPGAVATLGTAYTRAQVAALARYAVRAVCFDAEPAAQRRAARLCETLSAYEGTTENVVLQTGKDAAEASKAEVAELRKRYLE